MREFLRAAAIRAVRTMAQTAIAMIGTAQVIGDVDWRVTMSATVLAGWLSVLTSIAFGIPESEGFSEVEDEEIEDITELEA